MDERAGAFGATPAESRAHAMTATDVSRRAAERRQAKLRRARLGWFMACAGVPGRLPSQALLSKE